MTPLLCVVWWAPIVGSFSRTASRSPENLPSSSIAVASPIIPPPTITRSKAGWLIDMESGPEGLTLPLNHAMTAG